MEISTLRIDENGAYERELEQNWAAAYAKRLSELEASERDHAITEAVALEAAARAEEIAAEAAAREAADNALAGGTALGDAAVRSRHISDGNVTTEKIHDLDVTEDKLADGAVTFKKLGSDIKAYSASPVQVGIWTDGTPVWRVAISRTVTQEDISRGYCELTRQDLGVTVEVGDIALIANSFFGLYARGSGGISDMTPVSCGAQLAGYRIGVGGAASTLTYLRGWLEFVTDAENIGS